MRGSVTELMKNRGYGSILGEDGCVVYFDEKALDGSDFRALSIGNWVEYEEQYRGERTRAVKVRPIPNPKIAAAHCR
jgi:cold shock CspA family protein